MLRRCAWLLMLAGAAAGAQPVYKCSADGKVSYGQQPCAAGTSVALDLPATPAPAPGSEAALARQKKEAARLERLRHEQEAIDTRQQARDERGAAAYRKKCAALALKKKWADEDAAKVSLSARNHNQGKAQLKARRAAEKLALECPP